MLAFKLKTAINVDELIGKQNFEFRRKSTRKNKMHIDIVGCKIRGLRGHSGDSTLRSETSVSGLQNQDDGTRELKIYGCDYCDKIPL